MNPKMLSSMIREGLYRKLLLLATVGSSGNCGLRTNHYPSSLPVPRACSSAGHAALQGSPTRERSTGQHRRLLALEREQTNKQTNQPAVPLMSCAQTESCTSGPDRRGCSKHCWKDEKDEIKAFAVFVHKRSKLWSHLPLSRLQPQLTPTNPKPSALLLMSQCHNHTAALSCIISKPSHWDSDLRLPNITHLWTPSGLRLYIRTSWSP